MASKLQPKGNPAAAVKAAAAVATKVEPSRGKDVTKIVNVRFPETDHNELRAIFAGKGVPLARAASLATSYVGDLVKSGAIQITRAGIIDRRG